MAPRYAAVLTSFNKVVADPLDPVRTYPGLVPYLLTKNQAPLLETLVQGYYHSQLWGCCRGHYRRLHFAVHRS